MASGLKAQICSRSFLEQIPQILTKVPMNGLSFGAFLRQFFGQLFGGIKGHIAAGFAIATEQRVLAVGPGDANVVDANEPEGCADLTAERIALVIFFAYCYPIARMTIALERRFAVKL